MGVTFPNETPDYRGGAAMAKLEAKARRLLPTRARRSAVRVPFSNSARTYARNEAVSCGNNLVDRNY
jgi:hypothetical protein